MIATKENSMKCLWLMVLISFICLANARQIRYSRYNTEVIEDSGENQNSTNVADNEIVDDENEIEATVREIKLAPYPASGFRPSRAFPLPNEAAAQSTVQSDIEEPVTDESVVASTTETVDLTTSTQEYESEATTINNINEDDSEGGEDVLAGTEAPKAPYPPAGFLPRIPFLLPTDSLLENERQQEGSDNLTEVPIEGSTELPTDDDSETVEGGEDVLAETEDPKAPYPPAGFQPRIPFLLPTDSLFKSEQQGLDNLTEEPIEDTTDLPAETEAKAPYPAAGYRPSKAFLLPSEQLQLQDENKADANPQTNDNSNHPVCGSSTNPLAPKPLDGEKEDPDSETINVNTDTLQISQQQRAAVIPVRFSVHPLLLARPLIYTAPIPSSW